MRKLIAKVEVAAIVAAARFIGPLATNLGSRLWLKSRERPREGNREAD